MTVDRSAIFDQAAPAIGIGILAGSNATDLVELSISNSLIEGNDTGVLVNDRATAMVTACTISGGESGVQVWSQDGVGAVPARATVESSTISYNSFGVVAIASGGDNTARIYLSQDEVSCNSLGASKNGGLAAIYSFNNNRFTENASDGGPFAPIAFQ